ncbi:hypothetical protein JCM8547_007577 [Rhodosporidiobolus lusitaniae]
MSTSSPGGDAAPPLSDYLQGLARILVFALAATGILFGLTLRLSVTYGRLFQRDRRVFRILVSICAVLAAGHVAITAANLFNLVTPAGSFGAGSEREQTRIFVTNEVFTAAIMVVSQVFFVVRLWLVTFNWFMRIGSVFLWISATTLLIYWTVGESLDYGLGGKVHGTLGTVGIVTRAMITLCAAFVAVSLLYILPRVRPHEEPEGPSTRASRLYQKAILFVECSGLLAFHHLGGFIAHVCALYYLNATLTGTWFWFVFPQVAVFSVVFAVNQRPPPPLPPSSRFGTTSKANGTGVFHTAPLDENRSFAADASNPGGGADVMVTSSFIGGAGGAGGGTVIFDPDDPQTWRGDAQRMYPSIRFGDSIGAEEEGQSSLVLGTVPSRPGMSARSMSQRSIGGRSVNSLVRSGGVGIGLTSRSTDGRGGGGVPSFLSFGGSAGKVEYDEELVDQEPTVMTLNLDALRDVKPTTAAWGPAEEKKGDDAPLDAPDSPSSGSTRESCG